MRLLLALWLCIYSSQSNGQRFVLASSHAPPHVISESDSGIDLDVALKVLNLMGYKVVVSYQSLSRGQINVEKGIVDGITPIFLAKDKPGFYVSDASVRYKPTFFTLKRKGISLGRFTDLKTLRLTTFQGATGYFGPRFAALKSTPGYREAADMSSLPELLLKERTEVVLLDYYIFYYFFRLGDLTRDISVFQEHKLIPQVDAGVGFHDDQIRDRFNRYLVRFKSSDAYPKILQKYVGEI